MWVLTGMSGAGKNTALMGLERAGVTCVDNLPVALLDDFATKHADGPAAVVIDARQGERLADFDARGTEARVLFLDARDDVITRRLGESTRPHPCEDRGRGLGAVAAERALLAPLRATADVVIDTSDLTPVELQGRVRDTILGDSWAGRGVAVTVSSFGFKHGPQLEADWVVDARLMRNPFWEPELRPLTGLDAAVREYVLAQAEAREMIERLSADMAWALPRYAGHGRRFLHVAVGCTGGRHRSVVIAEELAERLRAGSIAVTVRHRDAQRPDPRG